MMHSCPPTSSYFLYCRLPLHVPAPTSFCCPRLPSISFSRHSAPGGYGGQRRPKAGLPAPCPPRVKLSHALCSRPRPSIRSLLLAPSPAASPPRARSSVAPIKHPFDYPPTPKPPVADGRPPGTLLLHIQHSFLNHTPRSISKKIKRQSTSWKHFDVHSVAVVAGILEEGPVGRYCLS